MNDYILGNIVTLLFNFVDNTTQQGADPQTVTATITDPAGASQTLTYGIDAALVRDSAGAYHVDYTPAAAGVYQYFGQATGFGASRTPTKSFAAISP